VPWSVLARREDDAEGVVDVGVDRKYEEEEGDDDEVVVVEYGEDGTYSLKCWVKDPERGEFHCWGESCPSEDDCQSEGLLRWYVAYWAMFEVGHSVVYERSSSWPRESMSGDPGSPYIGMRPEKSIVGFDDSA